jgi:hypothetical protein
VIRNGIKVIKIMFAHRSITHSTIIVNSNGMRAWALSCESRSSVLIRDWMLTISKATVM